MNIIFIYIKEILKTAPLKKVKTCGPCDKEWRGDMGRARMADGDIGGKLGFYQTPIQRCY